VLSETVNYAIFFVAVLFFSIAVVFFLTLVYTFEVVFRNAGERVHDVGIAPHSLS